MFYTLVAAHTYDTSWNTSANLNDLTELSIDEIYAQYSGCILVLERPNVQDTFYLDLFLVHSLVDDLSMTIPEWLEAMGARALPTTTSEPYETQKYVLYNDAVRANYSIKAIPGDRHPSVPVTEGEKTDLLLSREDRDYLTMSKYVMVSVNGLFHRVEAETDGLRVKGGWRTSRITNDQHVGIYSFLNIGEINSIRIEPTMIRRDSETVPLRFKARINPGVSLANKTVFVVLAGYLHALDSLYTVEDDEVVLDLSKYRIATRVYDGLRRGEYSEAVKSFRHQSTRPVDKTVLDSDEFYSAYLSDADHSFLVIISNPNVFKDIQPVEDTRLSSTYLSPKCPNWPLVAGVGRMAEYWPLDDDEGKKVLRCYDTHYANFTFEQNDIRNMNLLDGTLDVSKPFSPSPAHYLKIYTPTITADQDQSRPITDGETVVTPDRLGGSELLLISSTGGGGFGAINGPNVHTWGNGDGWGWMSSKAYDGTAGFDLVYQHDPKYPNDTVKVVGGYQEGTLALRSDGSIVQIAGTGYSLPFGITGVKDIAVGGGLSKQAAIIDSDGNLITSGVPSSWLTPTSGLDINLKLIAIHRGYNDLVGVDEQNNVWVWGRNGATDYQSLMRYFSADNRVPWDLEGANIIQLIPKGIGDAARFEHGYTALDDRGNIWVLASRWTGNGNNYYLQSGKNAGLPSWVADLNVRHIIETNSSIWGVITTDDEVYFWGSKVSENNPAIVSGVPIDIQGQVLACVANTVTFSSSAAVALLKDGTFRSWGNTTTGSGPSRPATFASGHGELTIDVSRFL